MIHYDNEFINQLSIEDMDLVSSISDGRINIVDYINIQKLYKWPSEFKREEAIGALIKLFDKDCYTDEEREQLVISFSDIKYYPCRTIIAAILNLKHKLVHLKEVLEHIIATNRYISYEEFTDSVFAPFIYDNDVEVLKEMEVVIPKNPLRVIDLKSLDDCQRCKCYNISSKIFNRAVSNNLEDRYDGKESYSDYYEKCKEKKIQMHFGCRYDIDKVIEYVNRKEGIKYLNYVQVFECK
jgi:hypothetical protein